MKKTIVQLVLGVFMTMCARADTALTIDGTDPFGCFQNANIYQFPETASGSFTLNGVSGTGTVQSKVPGDVPTFGYPPETYIYDYSISLPAVSSATTHCVKLLIHFGAPSGCGSDVVYGNPATIQSARLAVFGDITFVFAGGCLEPGQPAVGFTMFSGAAPTIGTVTVIDDYTDPTSGTNIETRINVTAVVPDIPPDPPPFHSIPPFEVPWYLQGFLGPHTPNPGPQFNGSFDFEMQMMDAPTNGYAVSQVITQAVVVSNGLFNMPSPFDPSSLASGASRWLSIAVRPTGSNVAFTPINPPLAITPTPQAFYAFTAGTVADLAPGQAVTSLNGLTGAVNLQAANGIILGTNGNTLLIAATGSGPSDRNLKTGFTAVNPEAILSQVAALPIASWRFTNEVDGVRHLGPMAQDFKAAFGLGNDEKMIGYLDENGVALVAIQGLNEKVEGRSQKEEARIQKLEAENTELKARLERLEQVITSMNKTEKPN